MAKLNLSEIKARSTGHFFDKATMRFFAASNWPGAKQSTKYGTKYDEINDINYVVVTDPWGQPHYHKFNESDGSMDCASDEDIAKLNG
jgi:hypothetical protein